MMMKVTYIPHSRIAAARGRVRDVSLALTCWPALKAEEGRISHATTLAAMVLRGAGSVESLLVVEDELAKLAEETAFESGGGGS